MTDFACKSEGKPQKSDTSVIAIKEVKSTEKYELSFFVKAKTCRI